MSVLQVIAGVALLMLVVVRPDDGRHGPVTDTEQMAAALRGNPRALSRIGVTVDRGPWWRRRLQAWLAPDRYRLWLQRAILAQLDEATD